METNIVGESLFNDGIGVVIFATLLQISAVGIENFGTADIAITNARHSENYDFFFFEHL
ncbi:NhaP-type Na+/H+ or K+/H+ antiporter [Dyadobacter sp. BE34]|uniref:NhaP-type Na+/H+ or K+/H+ antiporter n=1 Tax=Dyadobacter fermentans TaxID=94254 RepID=A0ABU1R8B7_9BACT|nr:MULTISPECIES: hypothetical protein [Dyadobacter]MDR6809640.1 NhaP-type Na+/H+ or K+/H+ antiporter [Dyadobacter fermentans]MDR7047318.1 NhaP-type Na+/H+ or K+/H+ antiporter [Dyadobacter sp. BE242]MDR7201554.1 NhaP-type Na+/H+ or K+/H+ antiporter [Dyadobacter sp. BE34]MDR7219424.1 NhaP-type Na+/H+ or K+/H+ antiporter [Dyadobacter sp. BE31]MDR7267182.1 NhaP-type Na+/H+ or K+/H+ antiporter [Dyadobacter sp. BE32]